jgi:ferric-dicitrate binding protein FerR (iron transport regulator)
VARDKKKPFTVISGNVYTTALGTHFNVNARDENKQRITLTEGSIKVEDKLQSSGPIILSPNQSIDYDSNKGFSVVTNVENLNEILWTQGVLKFENTPLIEVIKELESWYGVSITLEGEPSGLTYSGEFKDEYLTNILESMSFSLELEYSQENEFV